MIISDMRQLQHRINCLGVGFGLCGSAFLSALGQGVPARPPVPVAPRLVPPTPSPALVRPENTLTWDTLVKNYTAKPGDTSAPFTFSVTNRSETNVTITSVRTSCGCTVAKTPPTPWQLKPGDGGEIQVAMDLRAKFGVLTKSIFVDTSQGMRTLTVISHLPNAGPIANATPGANNVNVMGDRARNQMMAQANRQAVFQGDCRKCHADSAYGKTGERLYAAVCGVCHDAEHRATMVTDLRAPKVARNRDYWKLWITQGKAASLMPAFAIAEGGPLTDQQIDSLADYLDKTFPKMPVAAAGVSAGH